MASSVGAPGSKPPAAKTDTDTDAPPLHKTELPKTDPEPPVSNPISEAFLNLQKTIHAEKPPTPKLEPTRVSAGPQPNNETVAALEQKIQTAARGGDFREVLEEDWFHPEKPEHLKILIGAMEAHRQSGSTRSLGETLGLLMLGSAQDKDQVRKILRHTSVELQSLMLINLAERWARGQRLSRGDTAALAGHHFGVLSGLLKEEGLARLRHALPDALEHLATQERRAELPIGTAARLVMELHDEVGDAPWLQEASKQLQKAYRKSYAQLPAAQQRALAAIAAPSETSPADTWYGTLQKSRGKHVVLRTPPRKHVPGMTYTGIVEGLKKEPYGWVVKIRDQKGSVEKVPLATIATLDVASRKSWVPEASLLNISPGRAVQVVERIERASQSRDTQALDAIGDTLLRTATPETLPPLLAELVTAAEVGPLSREHAARVVNRLLRPQLPGGDLRVAPNLDLLEATHAALADPNVTFPALALYKNPKLRQALPLEKALPKVVSASEQEGRVDGTWVAEAMDVLETLPEGSQAVALSNAIGRVWMQVSTENLLPDALAEKISDIYRHFHRVLKNETASSERVKLALEALKTIPEQADPTLVNTLQSRIDDFPEAVKNLVAISRRSLPEVSAKAQEVLDARAPASVDSTPTLSSEPERQTLHPDVRQRLSRLGLEPDEKTESALAQRDPTALALILDNYLLFESSQRVDALKNQALPDLSPAQLLKHLEDKTWPPGSNDPFAFLQSPQYRQVQEQRYRALQAAIIRKEQDLRALKQDYLHSISALEDQANLPPSFLQRALDFIRDDSVDTQTDRFDDRQRDLTLNWTHLDEALKKEEARLNLQKVLLSRAEDAFTLHDGAQGRLDAGWADTLLPKTVMASGPRLDRVLAHTPDLHPAIIEALNFEHQGHRDPLKLAKALDLLLGGRSTFFEGEDPWSPLDDTQLATDVALAMIDTNVTVTRLMATQLYFTQRLEDLERLAQTPNALRRDDLVAAMHKKAQELSNLVSNRDTLEDYNMVISALKKTYEALDDDHPAKAALQQRIDILEPFGRILNAYHAPELDDRNDRVVHSLQSIAGMEPQTFKNWLQKDLPMLGGAVAGATAASLLIPPAAPGIAGWVASLALTSAAVTAGSMGGEALTAWALDDLNTTGVDIGRHQHPVVAWGKGKKTYNPDTQKFEETTLGDVGQFVVEQYPETFKNNFKYMVAGAALGQSLRFAKNVTLTNMLKSSNTAVKDLARSIDDVLATPTAPAPQTKLDKLKSLPEEVAEEAVENVLGRIDPALELLPLGRQGLEGLSGPKIHTDTDTATAVAQNNIVPGPNAITNTDDVAENNLVPGPNRTAKIPPSRPVEGLTGQSILNILDVDDPGRPLQESEQLRLQRVLRTGKFHRIPTSLGDLVFLRDTKQYALNDRHFESLLDLFNAHPDLRIDPQKPVIAFEESLGVQRAMAENHDSDNDPTDSIESQLQQLHEQIENTLDPDLDPEALQALEVEQKELDQATVDLAELERTFKDAFRADTDPQEVEARLQEAIVGYVVKMQHLSSVDSRKRYMQGLLDTLEGSQAKPKTYWYLKPAIGMLQLFEMPHAAAMGVEAALESLAVQARSLKKNKSWTLPYLSYSELPGLVRPVANSDVPAEVKANLVHRALDLFELPVGFEGDNLESVTALAEIATTIEGIDYESKKAALRRAKGVVAQGSLLVPGALRKLAELAPRLQDEDAREYMKELQKVARDLDVDWVRDSAVAANIRDANSQKLAGPTLTERKEAGPEAVEQFLRKAGLGGEDAIANLTSAIHVINNSLEGRDAQEAISDTLAVVREFNQDSVRAEAYVALLVAAASAGGEPGQNALQEVFEAAWPRDRARGRLADKDRPQLLARTLESVKTLAEDPATHDELFAFLNTTITNRIETFHGQKAVDAWVALASVTPHLTTVDAADLETLFDIGASKAFALGAVEQRTTTLAAWSQATVRALGPRENDTVLGHPAVRALNGMVSNAIKESSVEEVRGVLCTVAQQATELAPEQRTEVFSHLLDNVGHQRLSKKGGDSRVQLLRALGSLAGALPADTEAVKLVAKLVEEAKPQLESEDFAQLVGDVAPFLARLEVEQGTTDLGTSLIKSIDRQRAADLMRIIEAAGDPTLEKPAVGLMQAAFKRLQTRLDLSYSPDLNETDRLIYELQGATHVRWARGNSQRSSDEGTKFEQVLQTLRTSDGSEATQHLVRRVVAFATDAKNKDNTVSDLNKVFERLPADPKQRPQALETLACEIAVQLKERPKLLEEVWKASHHHFLPDENHKKGTAQPRALFALIAPLLPDNLQQAAANPRQSRTEAIPGSLTFAMLRRAVQVSDAEASLNLMAAAVDTLRGKVESETNVDEAAFTVLRNSAVDDHGGHLNTFLEQRLERMKGLSPGQVHAALKVMGPLVRRVEGAEAQKGLLQKAAELVFSAAERLPSYVTLAALQTLTQEAIVRDANNPAAEAQATVELAEMARKNLPIEAAETVWRDIRRAWGTAVDTGYIDAEHRTRSAQELFRSLLREPNPALLKALAPWVSEVDLGTELEGPLLQQYRQPNTFAPEDVAKVAQDLAPALVRSGTASIDSMLNQLKAAGVDPEDVAKTIDAILTAAEGTKNALAALDVCETWVDGWEPETPTLKARIYLGIAQARKERGGDVLARETFKRAITLISGDQAWPAMASEVVNVATDRDPVEFDWLTDAFKLAAVDADAPAAVGALASKTLSALNDRPDLIADLWPRNFDALARNLTDERALHNTLAALVNPLNDLDPQHGDTVMRLMLEARYRTVHRRKYTLNTGNNWSTARGAKRAFSPVFKIAQQRFGEPARDAVRAFDRLLNVHPEERISEGDLDALKTTLQNQASSWPKTAEFLFNVFQDRVADFDPYERMSLEAARAELGVKFPDALIDRAGATNSETHKKLWELAENERDSHAFVRNTGLFFAAAAAAQPLEWSQLNACGHELSLRFDDLDPQARHELLAAYVQAIRRSKGPDARWDYDRVESRVLTHLIAMVQKTDGPLAPTLTAELLVVTGAFRENQRANTRADEAVGPADTLAAEVLGRADLLRVSPESRRKIITLARERRAGAELHQRIGEQLDALRNEPPSEDRRIAARNLLLLDTQARFEREGSAPTSTPASVFDHLAPQAEGFDPALTQEVLTQLASASPLFEAPVRALTHQALSAWALARLNPQHPEHDPTRALAVLEEVAKAVGQSAPDAEFFGARALIPQIPKAAGRLKDPDVRDRALGAIVLAAPGLDDLRSQHRVLLKALGKPRSLQARRHSVVAVMQVLEQNPQLAQPDVIENLLQSVVQTDVSEANLELVRRVMDSPGCKVGVGDVTQKTVDSLLDIATRWATVDPVRTHAGALRNLVALQEADPTHGRWPGVISRLAGTVYGEPPRLSAFGVSALVTLGLRSAEAVDPSCLTQLTDFILEQGPEAAREWVIEISKNLQGNEFPKTRADLHVLNTVVTYLETNTPPYDRWSRPDALNHSYNDAFSGVENWLQKLPSSLERSKLQARLKALKPGATLQTEPPPTQVEQPFARLVNPDHDLDKDELREIVRTLGEAPSDAPDALADAFRKAGPDPAVAEKLSERLATLSEGFKDGHREIGPTELLGVARLAAFANPDENLELTLDNLLSLARSSSELDPSAFVKAIAPAVLRLEHRKGGGAVAQVLRELKPRIDRMTAFEHLCAARDQVDLLPHTFTSILEDVVNTFPAPGPRLAARIASRWYVPTTSEDLGALHAQVAQELPKVRKRDNQERIGRDLAVWVGALDPDLREENAKRIVVTLAKLEAQNRGPAIRVGAHPWEAALEGFAEGLAQGVVKDPEAMLEVVPAAMQQATRSLDDLGVARIASAFVRGMGRVITTMNRTDSDALRALAFDIDRMWGRLAQTKAGRSAREAMNSWFANSVVMDPAFETPGDTRTFIAAAMQESPRTRSAALVNYVQALAKHRYRKTTKLEEEIDVAKLYSRAVIGAVDPRHRSVFFKTLFNMAPKISDPSLRLAALQALAQGLAAHHGDLKLDDVASFAEGLNERATRVDLGPVDERSLQTALAQLASTRENVNVATKIQERLLSRLEEHTRRAQSQAWTRGDPHSALGDPSARQAMEEMIIALSDSLRHNNHGGETPVALQRRVAYLKRVWGVP